MHVHLFSAVYSLEEILLYRKILPQNNREVIERICPRLLKDEREREREREKERQGEEERERERDRLTGSFACLA